MADSRTLRRHPDPNMSPTLQDASGAGIVERISQRNALAERSSSARDALRTHLLSPGMADNSRGCGHVLVVQSEADVAHLIRPPADLSSLCHAPLLTTQSNLVLYHMDGDVEIYLPGAI